MPDSLRRPIPAVGVAVVEDGALLLVRRGRGPNAGLWAVPGGKVDYGESMHEAAVREMKEETGLDVEIEQVAWVGETMGPGNPPAWHYTLVDYLARRIGGTAAAADDAHEVAWVPLHRARELPLTPTMPSLIDVLIRLEPGAEHDLER
jgi:ADP-ribose pyrophosphatase YjhB (NUDIX family)